MLSVCDMSYIQIFGRTLKAQEYSELTRSTVRSLTQICHPYLFYFPGDMASARYISDMEDDESDQGAVQSAINKAMQVNSFNNCF